MKATSVLLGLFTAALLPATVAICLIHILEPYATYQWMPFTWLVALGVCLAHIAVFGAPALWILHRKARLSLKSALASGFLVGLLPTLALQSLQFLTRSGSSEPTFIQAAFAPAFTAALGAIGAWGFMYASGVSAKRHDA
jgi:hypothetical protein